ncbi:MAG TPA: DUF4333 domain-containing protein [Kofleriaceae bacterium]|nr:DUF4333 domain-containing protein [Kofleriaceae bacterium]
MKLRKVAIWVATLLVGGCEFHASCNSGRTLDMKNAEALVRRYVNDQVGKEPKVDCPSSVKIEKGARFDCAITIDDLKGVVTIEQEDDNTNVQIVQVTGLIVSGKLEGVIADKLKENAKVPMKVDCGPRVRPATPNDTFRCTATDPAGASADVVVTIKDTAGNVHFEVDKASIRQPAAPPAPPAEAPSAPAP